jgi:hypothetical protein
MLINCKSIIKSYWLTRISLIAIASVALASCGGGGGGGGGGGSSTGEVTNNTFDADSRNLALSTEGSSVVSTLDSGEMFVIDGDITTVNSWNPLSVDDTITVELSAISSLENITLRHEGLTSNSFFRIDLSSNGVDYTPLDFLVDCTRLQFGALFSCDFESTAQFVRLTIAGNEGNIELYEVEVTARLGTAMEPMRSAFIDNNSTWVKSCSLLDQQDLSNGYSINTITINNNAVRQTFDSYSDPACTQPGSDQFQLVDTGTFTVGELVDANGESARMIDIVYTSTVVDGRVSDQPFPPLYTLVQTVADSLYFGDAFSRGVNDGSTSALRPNELDFTDEYIRQ